MFLRFVAVGAAVLLLTGAAMAEDANTAPSLWSELGRGINLGNALEAPREGAWGVTIQDDYFRLIAEAGFKTVRIPVAWTYHADTAPPYAIDPVFLARVDQVADQALKNGLHVVLNDHNDDSFLLATDAGTERFVALWKQLGEHYRNAPPTVLFELCNEPHGKMTADQWNAALAQALTAVRATNPDRWIVVGPVQWNNISALPDLVLPESDRRLAVTVHFYEPFHFTHQGANWVTGSKEWLGTRWEGAPEDQKTVADLLERAAAWGRDHARPMFLGEFGAFSTAPMDDRARWTAFVARTAEAQNMAWAYWEFCSGFGAYDPKAKQWRQPLLQALIPPPGRSVD